MWNSGRGVQNCFAAQAEALIFDMNMALGHRGPDASGDYFDHNNSEY